MALLLEVAARLSLCALLGPPAQGRNHDGSTFGLSLLGAAASLPIHPSMLRWGLHFPPEILLM